MVKKQFKKTGSLLFGGALTLQGAKTLRDVRSGADLGGDIEGFATIGALGAVGNAAFDVVGNAYSLKKKRVKKRR